MYIYVYSVHTYRPIQCIHAESNSAVVHKHVIYIWQVRENILTNSKTIGRRTRNNDIALSVIRLQNSRVIDSSVSLILLVPD